MTKYRITSETALSVLKESRDYLIKIIVNSLDYCEFLFPDELLRKLQNLKG
jgi:hypothetical protein